MYAFKIMIHPNNKQATKIRRTLNKCIECNNIIFDYLDNKLKNNEKLPTEFELRRWFTAQKQLKDDETINLRKDMTLKEQISNHLDTLFYDVSNDALKQEIKDTYNSFIRYLKKQSKYPNKKNYKSYKKSFYVDPYKIRITDKKVRLEKIANNQKSNRQILNWISLAEKNRIPVNVKYYNPRVILENNHFYLCVGVDDEYKPKKKTVEKTNKALGIDINISSIVTSDDKHYMSVVKTDNYKKSLKAFKRAQKRLSKKYIISKEQNKVLRNCKNYIKMKKKYNKYSKRLLYLKNDHIDKIIKDIIDSNPNRICIENLDVREMKEAYNKEKKENPNIPKERKTIAKGIQDNPFSKFLITLQNRAYNYGIKIIKADRYYASSKTCNKCGNKKEDLKLSDRIFICPKCGLKIDRDYNAALNLRNYIK